MYCNVHTYTRRACNVRHECIHLCIIMSTIQRHNQYQNKLDSFCHRVFDDVAPQSNKDINCHFSTKSLPVIYMILWDLCSKEPIKTHNRSSKG